MDLDEQELKATKGIEKTADEMFELLGYIKVEDSKMCITYANDEIDSEMNFWKIDKTVSKTHYEKLGYMTMQELKAINKKMEELRMEKRLSLNEKIKRFTNNHLPKTRFLQLKYNGSLYEISYHKACFWWQERFSIKEYIKNLYTNHWEVNEVIDGSKILVMGNGSGIICGFFPKRKMKKQLYASARYWQQYKR